MQTQALRIIGIDPGLRNLGWGIIEKQGNALRFVAAGTVRSDAAQSLAARLCALHGGLSGVLARFRPHEAAAELSFVNKDAGATLKLGQARGVALLAPAQFGLPIAEYAPNAVKKTVIGYGHGDKAQIQKMIKILLPKADWDSADSADALAIAVCHAHSRRDAAKDCGQSRLQTGERNKA